MHNEKPNDFSYIERKKKEKNPRHRYIFFYISRTSFRLISINLSNKEAIDGNKNWDPTEGHEEHNANWKLIG